MESVLAILWAPRFSANYRRFVLRERLMFTSTVSYLEGRTKENSTKWPFHFLQVVFYEGNYSIQCQIVLLWSWSVTFLPCR